MAPRLRSWLRKIVPLEARQHYAQTRRRLRDVLQGTRFPQEKTSVHWPLRITLEQPIPAGERHQNKLINLRRGTAQIEYSVIQPGGQWSFWAQIGKPDAHNGFVAGRNIIDGHLTWQTGGGLCQLSGLIYHLALLAGLQVTERHPHSVDIYQEHQRFTPLGADATVAWGSKDLRLKNPYPHPISILCLVTEDRLIGQIHSEQEIHPRQVRFSRTLIHPGLIQVHTLIDDVPQSSSCYAQSLAS